MHSKFFIIKLQDLGIKGLQKLYFVIQLIQQQKKELNTYKFKIYAFQIFHY